MHRQHLLHQLSVLWSELASEDGIPPRVMESNAWEGREGRGGNEREGRRGNWREGERRGGEVHTHNSYHIHVNSRQKTHAQPQTNHSLYP